MKVKSYFEKQLKNNLAKEIESYISLIESRNKKRAKFFKQIRIRQSFRKNLSPTRWKPRMDACQASDGWALVEALTVGGRGGAVRGV